MVKKLFLGMLLFSATTHCSYGDVVQVSQLPIQSRLKKWCSDARVWVWGNRREIAVTGAVIIVGVGIRARGNSGGSGSALSSVPTLPNPGASVVQYDDVLSEASPELLAKQSREEIARCRVAYYTQGRGARGLSRNNSR